MAQYDQLVQDLKDYVLRDPRRTEEFNNAIQYAIHPNNGGSAEMEAEGIKSMEDYYVFCNNLLRWVPDVSTQGDALLRKLLVFYWVFNQANLANYQTTINPASIADDPKWLSYWQVIFAREMGRFLDTRESTSGIQSFYNNPLYNQEKNLWQDEPTGGWASFNQFFSRHWKDIDVARPLSEAERADDVFVSAADNRFNGHWDVEGGYVTIKGFHWPISKLLQDDSFNGTSFMHAFLGPTDYHRQHAPVSGTVIQARVIQEQVYLQVTQQPDQIGLAPDRGLLVVNSAARKEAKAGRGFRALDAPDEAGYQWCQTRGLIIIETENHGRVAVLPIGMAQVSSVVLSVEVGQKVQKGEEISTFQFGGSDLVMVFEKEVAYDATVGQKCNVRSRVGVFA